LFFIHSLSLLYRYLTAREQQLRDRRRKAFEKLDVNDQLKRKEEEIKQLENKTKQLKQLQEDMKWAAESKCHLRSFMKPLDGEINHVTYLLFARLLKNGILLAFLT
jgi:hypothetical protein